MFICEKCLDKFEGAPVEYAKIGVEMGMGSLGPCEICRKVEICADIPSSAPFHRKEKK